MPQLIKWESFPIQFNDKVKIETENTAAWFRTTYESGVPIDEEVLKYYILNRLDHMTASPIPTPRLTRVLLILGFYGLLKNPGTITFDDIENARWLLADPDYGVPACPRNPELLRNHPREWFTSGS